MTQRARGLAQFAASALAGTIARNTSGDKTERSHLAVILSNDKQEKCEKERALGVINTIGAGSRGTDGNSPPSHISLIAPRVGAHSQRKEWPRPGCGAGPWPFPAGCAGPGRSIWEDIRPSAKLFALDQGGECAEIADKHKDDGAGADRASHFLSPFLFFSARR